MKKKILLIKPLQTSKIFAKKFLDTLAATWCKKVEKTPKKFKKIRLNPINCEKAEN